jgi:hypothetical protein
MLRLFAPIVLMLAASACVRVPPRGMDAPGQMLDGSAAAELAVDASLRRPATAAPYTGPEAQPTVASTSRARAEADAGIGDWFDAGAGAAGGSAAGAAAGGGRAGSNAGSIARGPKRPSRAGQLVITEIMSNPQAVSDEEGEWFELYNPSASEALDLTGCTIDDGSKTQHAIKAALVLQPGGFATIARSANAGFRANLVLAVSLSNAMDRLALSCDGIVIDEVAYGPGFPLAPGASMALDPQASDARANDAAAAWCLAQPSYGTDRGTPGAPNAPCNDADGGA